MFFSLILMALNLLLILVVGKCLFDLIFQGWSSDFPGGYAHGDGNLVSPLIFFVATNILPEPCFLPKVIQIRQIFYTNVPKLSINSINLCFIGHITST